MMYRLTPVAQRDMREIDDWVLEQFGVHLADQTHKNLHDTFGLLTRYPHLGSVRADWKRPVRFLHLKPYWIVYQVSEPLLVHRVYHAARDLTRLKLK